MKNTELIENTLDLLGECVDENGLNHDRARKVLELFQCASCGYGITFDKGEKE